MEEKKVKLKSVLLEKYHKRIDFLDIYEIESLGSLVESFEKRNCSETVKEVCTAIRKLAELKYSRCPPTVFYESSINSCIFGFVLHEEGYSVFHLNKLRQIAENEIVLASAKREMEGRKRNEEIEEKQRIQMNGLINVFGNPTQSN